MRIVNNIAAINTHRNLVIADTQMGKVLEKLSSGLRINRAGDDASGLSISEKMRGQIRSTAQAVRNAQDAISLVQTAEGALDEVTDMLHRMRELTIQSGNGVLEAVDLTKLQDEVTELVEEIDRIAGGMEFNGKPLFDGTLNVDVQIGPDGAAIHTLNITIGALDATTLGVDTVDASDPTLLAANLTAIDGALENILAERSELGATQNRLEHTIKNLNVNIENVSASESRVRDADMAFEMTKYTKYQILIQSSTAMLAQANMKPQSVLQLLG